MSDRGYWFQTAKFLHRHERKIKAVPSLVYVTVSYAFGVYLSFQFHVPVFALVFGISFTFLWVILNSKGPFFVFYLMFLFLMLGLLGGTNSQYVAQDDIALSPASGRAVLEGIVRTVPEIKRDGKRETTSFVLEASSLFHKGTLAHASGSVMIYLYNAQVEIKYGNRLRLRGDLERPRAASNFYVFDFSEYLAKQRIFRVFRAAGPYALLKNERASNKTFLQFVHDVRVHIAGVLERSFPEPYGALAQALIVGFRKNIPMDVKNDFINTGTAHLLAISGLHISVLGGFIHFIGRWIRIPRKINLLMTVVFILLYALISGFRIPILRAGIMMAFTLLGLFFGLDRNIYQSFWLAIFMLLIWDPVVLFQASFQLSFLAIASLIFIYPRFYRLSFQKAGEKKFLSPLWNHLAGFAMTTSAVTIGMFPLLIKYFYVFSPIGMVANVFAIPIALGVIVSLFVVLLVHLLFSPLAPWICFVPMLLMKMLSGMNHFFAHIPFGHIYVSPMPSIVTVAYYAVLLAWAIVSSRRLYAMFRPFLGMSLLLIMLLWIVGSCPRDFRFVFFNLGENGSAFVKFQKGGNCLINVGRRFPSDQANWILKPFLMATGTQKIGQVLLTKVDSAHAGGFRTIATHFGIEAVSFPHGSDVRRVEKYLGLGRYKNKSCDFSTYQAGDGFRFSEKSGIDILISDTKNRVLLLFDEDVSILFISKFTKESLPELKELLPERLHAVVLIPENSFYEEVQSFLKDIHPDFVILNQHNGIESLRKDIASCHLSSRILITGETGSIEIYRQGANMYLRTASDMPSRFSSRVLPVPIS